MINLKIMSFNVRGLGNNKKREMFNFIKMRGADILLTQETHCVKNKQNVWHNEWGGKMYFSDGSTNSKGVCIMLKKGLNVKVNRIEKDKEGRWLCCEIKTDDACYVIANVYAPNVDNLMFFQELFMTLCRYNSGNVIVGGDFNLVLDSAMDRVGSTQNNHLAKELLLMYLDEYFMTDIWRYQNPETKRYTW